MSANAEIKVDLDKATIGDFIVLIMSGARLDAILLFADKVVEGGIVGRSMSELPVVVNSVLGALDKRQEDVSISIGSYLHHLMEDDSEDDHSN